MRQGLLVLFIFSYFIFLPSLVHAATPSPGAGVSITFSEVSACEENEWVELYNSADQDITIAGWKIEKKGEGSSTWSSKPVDSATATMSAKMYTKISVGSSFLSNSGFSLRLKDSGGDVVDENTFEKCPTSTTATSWIKEGEDWKLTTQRTPDSANTLIAVTTPTPQPQPKADQPVATTSTPTPKPQTPLPTSSAPATPGVQPTAILLSEVYACQNDTEKEWVELYNGANTSVTLTDWKLLDDDHNDQPIDSLSIQANGYAVVEIAKYSKGMLTNSGDVVNLIDGTGKKVDTFTYKSCTKGSSWSKSAGKWEQTTTTKGISNPQTVAAAASPQLEGDGGDIRMAAALGPEESSSSGYVLGAQSDSDASPEPSAVPVPKPTGASNWVAIGSIVTGIVILAGAGGYYGWTQYKKRQIPNF